MDLTREAHPIEMPPRWKCPVTGFVVEKTHRENIIQRKRIAALAKHDIDVQAALINRCRRSFLVWVNLFAYTYKQKEITEDGTQRSLVGDVTYPVLTWPVHDAMNATFDDCFAKGEDLVVPKSRDMFATWFFILKALHGFLFIPGFTWMAVSEKEDKVDGRNSDALFPRIRWVLDRIPAWMQPPNWQGESSFGALRNTRNGAYLNGDSTNENFGVGGRRAWILVDEAARNPYLQSVIDSTRDVSDTRVFLSTPLGPGAFCDLACSGKRRTFYVGFWDHPDKGRGREKRQDLDGSVTRHAGSTYWWSPWLGKELPKRTPMDVAQNLFIDFETAGNVVFSPNALARMKQAADANPPMHTGDLTHAKDWGVPQDHSIRQRETRDIDFMPREGGVLQLWCDLFPDKYGKRRPLQDRAYVIGSDVSRGLSASNSTAAVIDTETMEKVGMLVSSGLDDWQWARMLAMLGLWFGGRDGRALVAWERNGPGLTVAKHMHELYGACWTDEDGELGWNSTRDKKRTLLEDLSAGYSQARIQDFDWKSLDEAKEYVYTPTGAVDVKRLMEDKESRATHGDRVIATALAWKVAQTIPANKHTPLLTDPRSFEAQWERIVSKRKPKASEYWAER